MEGASNGGMLYHEVQELKLCAVHCVNTVLQGPFFSEFDLAVLASDLDRKERQMMMLELEGGGGGGGGSGGGSGGGGVASEDFVSVESHNISLDGDFSIQVQWFGSPCQYHSLYSLFGSSWKSKKKISLLYLCFSVLEKNGLEGKKERKKERAEIVVKEQKGEHSIFEYLLIFSGVHYSWWLLWEKIQSLAFSELFDATQVHN